MMLRDAQHFSSRSFESIRRIEYVSAIHKRKLSPLRADPSSDHFDPLKAAVLCAQRGDTDEAFWLVFLSVHFGRHGRDGWRLCRDVYAGTTPSALWTWAHVTSNVSAFRNWLAAQAAIWKNDGASRHFGNHHKYQSIDAWKKKWNRAAVQSYVEWVLLHKSHGGLVQDALNNAGVGPGKVFDYLYRSMEAVVSFGRMARFDYLTMVGKLGLAAIELSRPTSAVPRVPARARCSCSLMILRQAFALRLWKGGWWSLVLI